jgi:stearoyl-CoA desaturase (delta-9 desaturase)
MLAITGGYHRYFSHRSYRLKRGPQFVLAFLGTTAAQKGPLWWAAHHRAHHKYADTERDIHSPIRGFWWSHVGWILCDKFNNTDSDAIKDFTKYPELVWLDKHDWVGPWTSDGGCTTLPTRAGTRCWSHSSRVARDGTTTITATRGPPAKVSVGGRST